MSERRTASLLDFAIAASLAVVPVMLAVLVAVGTLRPADYVTRTARPATSACAMSRPSRTLRAGGRGAQRRVGVADGGRAAARRAAMRARVGPVVAREPAQAAFGAARCGAVARRAGRVAAERARRGAATLQHASERARGRGRSASTQRAGSRPSTSALGQPIETAAYAGRRFELRCVDLVDALGALLRADARMLDALSWRGTEAGATVARWRPDQQMEITERHVMRPIHGTALPAASAWGTVTSLPAPAACNRSCARRRWRARPARQRRSRCPANRGRPTPPTTALDGAAFAAHDVGAAGRLRQPSRALYRLYTDAEATGLASRPNRIVLDGVAVDVGFSLAHHDRPRAAGAGAEDRRLLHRPPRRLPRARHPTRRRRRRPVGPAAARRRDGAHGGSGGDRRGQRPHRGAGRRAVAVRAPGRSTARAATPTATRACPTPCSTGRTHCSTRPCSRTRCRRRRSSRSWPRPSWPTPRSARGGSPPNARRCGAAGAPARDSLRGELMRSDSARFLDRMFCIDKRLRRLPAALGGAVAAATFGWNAGCDRREAHDCGKHDLLFGRAVDAHAESGVQSGPCRRW